MRRSAIAVAASLIVLAATPALAQHEGHEGHGGAHAGTSTVEQPEADEQQPMDHSAHGAMDHSQHQAMDHSQMDHSQMDHSQMDHSQMDHSQHAQPADRPAHDHSQMDHSQHEAMDHSQHAQPANQPAHDHSQMDHSQHQAMDHSQHGQTAAQPTHDHSQMDHSQMDHSQHAQPSAPQDIPYAPPPPSAGSGPARAAEAIWGVEAMRESREELRKNQGGQSYGAVRFDRFEYRAREGEDGYLWDADAWYGGDIDKLWLKSEGEGSFGEDIEQAEVQALYSRAIGPWFDLQAGIRQDFAGAERTHAVLGVQGLAPYLFEVDGALFLSTEGELTASAEAELDQRITQRLILQPRAEISLSAQDIPEAGIGAGIDTIEAGIRLRYEFVREFAPYVGIEQEWKLGDSADYARAAGEDPSVTNFVVGLRFWF
ncbi:copper resistance protein B [Altererythrobacter aurantiacus]|uniref:Copper resistance protein B n=1 Tax=Parapontixanthobacter aurantiacus TaxID=1463599 RepID=A0A844ZFA9_9SPHN|nr:copper resistance protein B [Parapontixanthobacter aurantiacus]MXO85826.1 copper resistance protein B [Parapontixanthobacter aurantiacus]